MTENTTVSRLRMMATNFGRNPMEFLDRVQNTIELYYHSYLHNRPRYDEIREMQQVVGDLGQHLSVDIKAILQEEPLHRITQYVIDGFNNPKLSAVRSSFNAHLDLARLCYILCRARKPQVVVETGVANGVTSTFILQALEVNGSGELHSIDLPPLAVYDGSEVGSLIPQNLRHRWRLNLGSSRRLLPPLAERLGKIDMFVHDSLHSYHNVRREMRVASKKLAQDGIMVVDNVAGNSAFPEWVRKHKPKFHAVVPEGKSLFGFALK
jgi:predicted O-methyltransferase YrrM